MEILEARFFYMMKYGARLTFAEERNNLYYFQARVTDEVAINNFNFTIDKPKKTN